MTITSERSQKTLPINAADEVLYLEKVLCFFIPLNVGVFALYCIYDSPQAFTWLISSYVSFLEHPAICRVRNWPINGKCFSKRTEI